MTFVTSKTIAVLLSSVLISTTVLPVASAHADHKQYKYQYKKQKHHNHHSKKQKHSKHKKYKKKSSKKIAKHRSKRSNRDDKIVAGILGFALGAVVINEIAKNKRPHYQPSYHQPQHVYREPVYREPVYNQPNYSDPYYSQRRSLDNVYAAPVYNAPSAPVYKKPSGPKVIRYENNFTSTSFEPWTPEWQNYCSNKFRSFNSNTGTYRGYDGLNHFCIAK